MKNTKRSLSVLLAVLLLTLAVVSGFCLSASAVDPSSLKSQNAAAYAYMKKTAGLSSFNGWCGAYVGHTLVYLGINQSYVGRNGCDHWDYYSRLTQTSGGYSVEKYASADYTLESALKALASKGDVTNVILCFEKGSGSSDGQKYGHVIFLHAISDGTVYYSECFTNSSYAEGALRAETIAKVCARYRDNSSTSAQEYRFEGAIRFYKQTAAAEDGWSEVMATSTKPVESAFLKIVRTETTYNYFHYCCNYYNGNMNVDSIVCGSGSPHYHTLSTASELPTLNVADQGGKAFFLGTKCSCGFQAWAKADTFKTVTYYYQVKGDASVRDPWTYSSVTPTRVLSYGGNPNSVMAGSDVQWVQCALNTVDNAGLQVDGKFGPKCSEKVKNFQRETGLTVDGNVGPQTYAQLVEQLHHRGYFEPHSCKGVASASCTANEVCSVCGTVLQTALGHSYTAKVTAPTCTKEGYTTHTCTRCGDSYTDSRVSAKGHTPGSAATCTSNQTCTTCGAVVKNKLGHSYTAKVIAPTCTAEGYTTHTCTRCGDSYTDSKVSAKGHTPTVIPAIPATCTDLGKTEGSKCAVCGEILARQTTVAPLGHTEEILPAKEATCTEAGLTAGARCEVCGDTLISQKEIPAKGHTEVMDPAKAPTCTEAGLADGKHCSVCGDRLVAQMEVPAIGHTPGDWATTVEPAVGTEGRRWQACVICGGILHEETIPALPEETEPITEPETDPVDEPDTAPATDPVTEPDAAPKTHPEAETPPVTETPSADPATTEDPTAKEPSTAPTVTVGCSGSVLSCGLLMLVTLAGAVLIKRKE